MKRPPETMENPYRHSASDASRLAFPGGGVDGEEGENRGKEKKKKVDQIRDNIVGFKCGRLLPFSLSVCWTTFNKHPSDVNRSSGRQRRTGSPTKWTFWVFFCFFLIQIR